MSDTRDLVARLERFAEDLDGSTIYGHEVPTLREAIAALSAPADGLRERLTEFVARERALRDEQNKRTRGEQTGMTVGYGPSISPSTLRELGRILSAPAGEGPHPPPVQMTSPEEEAEIRRIVQEGLDAAAPSTPQGETR